MKSGTIGPDIGERIVRFQRRLLEGLRPLEAVYFVVKREQKRLVRNKSGYDAGWFRRRMSKLSGYGATLLDAIAIGRALGDGYAWLFYERDRALVRQHLRQPRQPLLPTGIGGDGERLVAAAMPSLDGRLLIYHGLTSFLRMGDVSLIDLKTRRVDAIGELKTQKIDASRINLTLSFLADAREKLPRSDPRIPVAEGPPLPLDPAVRQKLDRQMETISKSMAHVRNGGPDRKLGHEGEFYGEALADVVGRAHGRHFEFVRAGPGLILGALLRPRNRQLGSRLLDLRGVPKRLVRHALDHVRTFIVSDIGGNAVIIGGLGAGHEILPLTDHGLPFVWWNAPTAALRSILLGETMIVTLYNPAHLLAALRERGFQLKFNSKGGFESAVLKEAGRQIELRELDRFHRLIGQNLMNQQSVLAMIEASVALCRTLESEGAVRVNIDAIVSRGPEADEDT